MTDAQTSPVDDLPERLDSAVRLLERGDTPAALAQVIACALNDAAKAVRDLRAEVERLHRIHDIDRAAINRWVPCPDHRDKTECGRYYVCDNEGLERRAAAAEAKLATAIALLETLCGNQHPEVNAFLAQAEGGHHDD